MRLESRKTGLAHGQEGFGLPRSAAGQRPNPGQGARKGLFGPIAIGGAKKGNLPRRRLRPYDIADEDFKNGFCEACDRIAGLAPSDLKKDEEGRDTEARDGCPRDIRARPLPRVPKTPEEGLLMRQYGPTPRWGIHTRPGAGA